VYLELADSTLGAIVEMIQCGEHIPPDDGWDVLINTHKHDNVDRYGDEARPE
jgi:hypothetical protein